MLIKAILVLLAPLFVVLGVPILIKNAASIGLVQQANARSSHTGIRPSGAGIVLTFATLISGCLLALILRESSLIIPLAIITGLACVGFADDVLELSAKFRLGAQILAMVLMFSLTKDFAPFSSGSVVAIGAVLLSGLAAALFINLYNFMDGIDGIAATQAAFVLVALLVLVAIAAPDGQFPASTDALWLFVAAAALSAIVFLVFNWARAKVFGGDAGAYFYAATIVFAGTQAVTSAEVNWASFAILLAAFLTDSLVTLTLRLMQGQKVWQAHRTHAYQHLAQRHGHALTVKIYVAFNILWLFPLAVLVQVNILNQFLALALAYVPAILFVMRNGAGRQSNV